METKDQANLHRLVQKHEECEARLAELAARRFPTDEEQYEEATLKKLKLRIKDEMESMKRHG
ncbi:MAG TPA: YdcH family protein [Candidatus Polarisedimenticolaceae bacterium]|nr:YdcH family protein [Candidatus Polarisedimenticolaceae bacterium]